MENHDMVPVVLHYRDGRTERGNCNANFSDAEESVHIDCEDEIKDAPFSDLKALFFIRPTGSAALEESEPSGSSLAVEFFDGEVIRGRSPHYNTEGKGFFLFPSDRSKNEKIFVVKAAILSIEVEKF
ncbi:MAG TPA: hypothetical protein VHL58_19330 [Thermoanaerobaculia bacterium]|nr:hypothetical protein [Thermoanaerobaculia bacterium]